MPPRVEARFEESWILGEEGGITSTNDHGVHLRIVARAIMAAGSGTAGTRNKSRKLGRRGKASASASRQFDLFIDGRSYFDLPLLDESTGELVAAPIISTYTSTCTGNGFDDSASTKTGSYDQVEEDEEEEVHEEGASIEDWTANGSAIASNDDACKDDGDDDLDSVDGFMANIDLSGKHEDIDLAAEKSSKGSAISPSASGESHKAAARGYRMASAKSNLQRSTARTAEKIGSSTKKGTKKFVAGTSKVFTSPIALIKRTSTDNRKGGGGGSCSSDDERVINTCADGNALDCELGNDTDPSATAAAAATNTTTRPTSSKEEDSRRLNHSTITSFSELHNTMMPAPASASTGAPQRNETGYQVNEEDAPNAGEIVAQLREQIFHLEREIAHNADRVAAEVERSVAISEIEARMVRERDQGEII